MSTSIVLWLTFCFALSASAFTFLGYPAGCIFKQTLTPYQANTYNNSAVFFNSAFVEWNLPSLLYNGPGPYSFYIPADTAGAGLIGASLTGNLHDLDNYYAYTAARNWSTYLPSEAFEPGSGQIFYGLASLEYAGSIQFAFQINSVAPDRTVEIQIAAFMINTNDKHGSSCTFSDRSSTIMNACPEKWVPLGSTCGE